MTFGLFVASLFPAVRAAPPYLEGSTAGDDAFAPVDFRVVDPDATVALLEQTSEEAPVVVRFDASVSETAVEQLQEVFARTRRAFKDALEKEFGDRTISIRQINSARFRGFRNDFQSANPRLPVNLVLAQSWAKGYDGESTLDRLTDVLRAVTVGHPIGRIRPASTVFLLSVDADERVRSWGEISSLARTLESSEVETVEDVGLEMRRMLDALDRIDGGFLSGLIQPSIEVDDHFTALLLQERFGNRTIHRDYQKGDVIARKGENLSHWSALALNHLQRVGLEPASAPNSTPAVVRAKPVPNADTDVRASANRREPSESVPGWTFWAVGAGTAVFIIGGLLFLRRRLKKGGARGDAFPAKRVEFREALLPHLARELKDRLVHVLFTQRHQLLENEEEASRRVAEMEERLSQLQPAIAEKIRSYERRIEELEQQLDEKDQETRDLIRAKLVLARRELDEEIERNRIRWN